MDSSSVRIFLTNFYPLLLFTDLVLLLRFSLKEIRIGRKDIFPLAVLFGISLSLLVLDTPGMITLGEAHYVDMAENILGGNGAHICAWFEDGECSVTSVYGNPPGLSFFMVPLVALFGRALAAFHFGHFVMNLAAAGMFYLAARELSSRRKALVAGILFTLLIPRVRLQSSNSPEILSVFLFLFGIYLLKRYWEGRSSLASVAPIFSYVVHVRPHGFLMALPVVGLLLYSLRGKHRFFSGLMVFNLLWAGSYVVMGALNDELWTPGSDKIVNFVKNAPGNLLFFFDLQGFNPLLAVLSVIGIFNSLRKKDAVMVSLALSLIIGVSLVSAFHTGRMMSLDSESIRYFYLVMSIVVLFALGSIPEKFPGALLLVLVSLFVLFGSPIPEDKSLHAQVYAHMANDTLGLAGHDTIAVHPPSLVHIFFPEKRVFHPGFWEGEFILVNNPISVYHLAALNASDPFYVEGCRKELLAEVEIPGIEIVGVPSNWLNMKKFLVHCESPG